MVAKVEAGTVRSPAGPRSSGAPVATRPASWHTFERARDCPLPPPSSSSLAVGVRRSGRARHAAARVGGRRPRPLGRRSAGSASSPPRSTRTRSASGARGRRRPAREPTRALLIVDGQARGRRPHRPRRPSGPPSRRRRTRTSARWRSSTATASTRSSGARSAARGARRAAARRRRADRLALGDHALQPARVPRRRRRRARGARPPGRARRSRTPSGSSRRRRLAELDSLTGLANQRVFHELLAREVARSRRYGRRLSLIVLDLDDFKRINDRIGHLAGDAVLAEVAARLRSVVRSTDIACRVGGDEFAVILPESTRGDADHLAARIERAVAQRADREGGNAEDLGRRRRALSRRHGQRLFDRADEDLYRAKAAAKRAGRAS